MVERRIASRYLVQKVLGEGGEGKTLLVTDSLQGDRPFVVKLLAPSVKERSVRREFELLRSLYHPHIVEVAGCGRLEDASKAFYLVMEFVDGRPIDQALEPLTREKAWEPIGQVCRTLSYLHDRKVIHGDLKPSNILVIQKQPDSSQVKLIDFGLARLQRERASPDLPAGTLAYMAPEIITQGVLSPRSDLYALGILLYQLISGHLPFPLTPPDAIRFHLEEEPSYAFLRKHRWGGILEKILRQLLHKDPSRRLQDSLQVLTLLNEGAGTSFAVHRGWQEAGEEHLFLKKIDDYLNHLNPLLQLPAVTCPRSFLEEELGRIEHYLNLSRGLSVSETKDFTERLAETKARLLIQQGRYDEVLKVQGESDALKNIRALAHIYRAEYEEAERILTRIALEGGQPIDRARAQNYLGISAYNQGNWKESASRSRQSLDAMRRLGETAGIVSNAMNLAASLQQEGKIAEALRLYKESLEEARSLHNSYLLAHLLSNMANLHILLGALKEAERHLQRSQRLAEELHLVLLKGYNLLLFAEISVWRRDSVTADQQLSTAMGSFEEIGAWMHLAAARINYAENGLRAHLWGELPERIARTESALRKAPLPDVRFRFEILKIQCRIAQSPKSPGIAEALGQLKASTPRERFLLAATRAQWDLSQKDFPSCERDLSELKSLYEKELEEVPLVYRMNLTASPRYALYWEIHEQWTRLQKAPAEETLWRLVEINKRIVTYRNAPTLYPLILDAALELTGAARGFLILPEHEKWTRGTWKVEAARNFRRSDLPRGRDLLSQAIIERVLKGRQPLLIQDAQTTPDLSPFKSVAALKLRSILAVPIIVHGEMIGALYLDHSDAANLFGSRDLEIVKVFADQAGIAIANARFYEKSLRREKTLDEMRRQLEEANQLLKKELRIKSEWAERVSEELKKVQTAGPLVGRSEMIRHLIKQLPSFAKSRQPVVVSGEIGTGKDLVAAILHETAGGGPFLHQTALSLPRQKTTGGDPQAVFQLLKQTKGGTLYLDELTDLPPAYQKDLWRFLRLQKGPPPVFLILASRTRLNEAHEKGLLIPELYQTLAGSEIHLLPLRQRKEDIAPLVRHFLHEIGRRRAVVRGISPAALGILHAYDWPGNCHELQLEIDRAALASTATIVPTDLSPNLLSQTGFIPGAPKQESDNLHDKKRRFERDQILQVLGRTGWNKVRTAKKLGLSRTMLYNKLERYKIPFRSS